MATFDELQQALGDPGMATTVQGAIVKKAAAIVNEASPSADRLQFAQDSLANPSAYVKRIWGFMVGNNSGATLDAILRSVGDPGTPTDASIETNVNTAIDKFWP